MKKNGKYVGVDEKYIPEDEKYVDNSLNDEIKNDMKDSMFSHTSYSMSFTTYTFICIICVCCIFHPYNLNSMYTTISYTPFFIPQQTKQ